MSFSSSSLLRTYVIGLFMGTADGVPGVSGGTIALIAGVYLRLIDAINAVTPRNASKFLTALVRADVDSIREVLEETDAVFLLALGCGILTAVIIVTRIVTYANEHAPVVLFGIFFGLIAASVVVLARQLTLSESHHYGVALAGFLIAFVLSGDITLLEGNGAALVFVGGAFAVSAMILPGISGSLILVILGQYVFMSETLAEFTTHIGELVSGGTTTPLVDPGTTIAVFLAGGVIGLFTVARAIEYSLTRAPRTTLVFLVSLVVGALRAPITEINSTGTSWSAETVGVFLLSAAVGAVILYGLDHFAIDVEIEAGKVANSTGQNA
ncbi:DUF368 domain-containing protein [Halovenus marina]|uniref:DUF368 domain-containing protein n=1 Tax=Halovenus marina TaxID=3396621 RepID=UPI003F569A85